MTMFLVLVAGLVAAALLFVLPTLMRSKNSGTGASLSSEVNLQVLRDQLRELDRDLGAGIINQDDYQSAKLELERRVSTDVLSDSPSVTHAPEKLSMVVGIGLLIPVVAISLYLYLGSPLTIEAPSAQTEANQAATDPANPTPEQIAKMVAQLEQHLKQDPSDATGLAMLARSYHALGRYQDATQAYARLVKLNPNDANLLADYADAMAMSQNKTLQGEPEKIIAQALSIDPVNLKALSLAASAAFERRDYQNAIQYWKKILPLVEADSEIARATTNDINEAQNLAGAPEPAAESRPAIPATKAAGASLSLEGEVSIDTKLKGKADPNDTVFIFARAAEGPRFPLAVLRKQVKDLPVKFALDDTMGMMPNVKLSDYASVVVGARVSKSGSATPSAGDLEGLSKPVQPGSKNLKISIDMLR
ncbi:cytochrome c-type biogenesis protein CcmH [Oxalobacteraceae bacterium GrIS 2.11]